MYSYRGAPRQDIPHHVYRDAAMFDDVFDKQGKLLQSRDTPKITNPLHSLGYSSLHDPHCRKLFLNNKSLRSHLMDLGLITGDLKVVASTNEQRQKIRAHELLERKETLLFKLETQEQQRIQRLQRAPRQLPSKYLDSMLKSEKRMERAEVVQQMKMDKIIQAQERKEELADKKRLAQQKKMKQATEEAKLFEQAKRNAARHRQECAELAAYERQYGKFGRQLAIWHRDSDRIHNRMILMERTCWSKQKEQKQTEDHPRHAAKLSPTESSAPSTPSQHSNQPQIQKESVPVPGELAPQTDSEELAIPVNVEEDSKEKSTSPALSEVTKDIAQIEEKSWEIDTTAATAASKSDVDIKPTTYSLQEVEESITNLAIQDEKAENVFVTVLDRDQSDAQLTTIFVDALQRMDYQGRGFVSIDDFTQLLNSRDLGLQLNENELLYIAEQVDPGNGWVPFVPVAQQLPEFLVAMYNQRAELQTQQYGAYMEDQWCQMYLLSGVTYYNKLTGEILTGGRPEDFRPHLKEDPFEESIVDFFETADTDKDGVININNFYSLLVSPMVSTRIYSNQMEDLLTLFQESSENGLATLETFAPIVKILLVMIYQNAYPDVEEWIELDSRKCGTFLFNKDTGETYVQKLSETGEATDTEERAKQSATTGSSKRAVQIRSSTSQPESEYTGIGIVPDETDEGTSVPQGRVAPQEQSVETPAEAKSEEKLHNKEASTGQTLEGKEVTLTLVN
ncbi:uncharacterized protein LOC135343685 isoform X2 [Halichondria panicea]|uniref:uncharacterized protein LOC135343685 isoform X2 n=1 Tax=Halichondria panicea TaxID=6063 RepID=UPI00312B9D43